MIRLANPLALTFLAALLITSCDSREATSPEASEPATQTVDEVRAIATEAYVYGFPLVTGYRALYNYSVDTDHPEYKGPFNTVACVARLFTPDDTAIVTPNADTPYCMSWIDLRGEPLVLTVPDMEPDRFYHFQLIDLYTHNFAYIGTLTTGNGAGRFLLAGPGWEGTTPENIDGVLRSETDFIFSITRTQLFGSDDLDNVKSIQESYSLAPLSEFLGAAAPTAPPAPEFPAWVEGIQADERFFVYLDFLMRLIGAPHESEIELWDRFASIGLGPDGEFDVENLAPDFRTALAAGAEDGMLTIRTAAAELAQDPLGSAKGFGTREFLTESARENFGHDNHFLIRAVAALVGIYGNSAAEAIYPTYMLGSDGVPYDGSEHSYKLTFSQDQLPPVKAFWSLTMYDGQTQLFVRNALKRYLLNSTMLDRFVFEDDGSLVLHISKDSPGENVEANWLPAPDGPFYMVLRLYGPKAVALNGEWPPPELRKVD